MKLNLDTFLPKLAMANSVVNAKTVIPIQGDFLLHTENGKLYINASDGENTVSVSVEPAGLRAGGNMKSGKLVKIHQNILTFRKD